jgi:hypothetical protein
MSDQNTTSGDPIDPQPWCTICEKAGHTATTKGFHDTGRPTE